MILTSTISSKGQTTIPADIQRLLNVKPGDKLQYFTEADGRVTILPKILSVKDLEGVLPKPKRALTAEEMDKAIQRQVVQRRRKSNQT